jgi:hypothetical protein
MPPSEAASSAVLHSGHDRRLIGDDPEETQLRRHSPARGTKQMIFDDRLSGTSLDTIKSTNSLGLERPSGTIAPNRPDQAVRRRAAQLTRLAAQALAGLITRARLAFVLRWSARRRRHKAAV